MLIQLNDYYPDPCGDQESVEVSDEIALLLQQTTRDEHAAAEKERYHGVVYSYWDSYTDNLSCYEDDPTFLDLLRHEESAALQEALSLLTPIQRKRLEAHYFDHISYAQIAREEGVIPPAVKESVRSARKKLFKYLKNTYRFGPKTCDK